MKQHTKMMMLVLSTVMLIGCSPVNTQFSCNATAGDHCLSIEEVDAMTQTHEVHAGGWRERVRMAPMKADRSENTKRLAQAPRTIWVAPWRDERGVLHQNDTLWAEAPTDTTLG
jgi:conjugal transfer pilus assembly protein TraV